MSGATAVRDVVVPGWLAEVVRPRRAPVPWPEMIRAALAICVPLSVAYAVGHATLGVLPATGGLLGTMADAGGPYLSRVKRVCSAAVFGGAAGLVIGSVTHGRGWLAVLALVVVAGVAGLLSAFGDIGSVTGLQLLVYTSLGAGPVGALRPVRHTAAGFLAGVGWALILILPGWLRSPYGREQRDVAAVYDALTGLLRAVGGCAIVLLIGFAPWPMSWYAHLPRQYARTALDVCRYLEVALVTGSGPGAGSGPGEGSASGGSAPPARSRIRRSTYRALAVRALLGVLGTGERLTV